ncbi:uncharacterized protein [Physcomitrium patens]|uniref:Acyl carrier protein n=1 Tax=Physcomitrium patens TaxID=3218 RepID=A9SPQ9_PHYPA|nr:uncharacterized protein LOC112276321 [Physcomitrium patens]PNR28649.1 hypothetical protein PHYPA_029242 [Physcomitrium patens]|eukprot:XP_024363292.1 uncharacterized protein LOC112276321 [Physcomitrella patens]
MQAARSSTLRALHSAVLQHLRVQPAQIGSTWGLFRAISAEAHAQGTCLSRSQVADRVLSVLKSSAKVDPLTVSETASFQNDLQLDTLDQVEIMMAIEDEFALEIPDADADNMKSTKDVIEYVVSHPRAK